MNDIKKNVYHKRARIISVDGITNHYQVARNDLKLCATIISRFDSRSGLWQSIYGVQPDIENAYGVASRNPVLLDILDFVIDEASAEEEELLGESVPFEPEVNSENYEQLLKVIILSIKFKKLIIKRITCAIFDVFTQHKNLMNRKYVFGGGTLMFVHEVIFKKYRFFTL